MQGLDVREGLGVVTLLAGRTILAFVDIRLWMAAGTIQWSRLEGLRWMAIGAAHLEVFAVQPEFRHGVVIELVITGFQVTAFALITEATFVDVIIGVTALG